MSNPVYELKDVKQSYQGRTVLAVDRLEVGSGSIVGFSGPNGSGKSTLIRILAFLEEPASGELHYRGEPVGPMQQEIRREVTLLAQEPYLLKRSVYANVSYGLKIRGINDQDLVDQALVLVGLEPTLFGRRLWFELSGGEAQRVALAARLVLRPKVLLLDEPTASLDAASTKLVQNAAKEARNMWGTTLVVVSHDMTWLRGVSDTILFFDRGRIAKTSHHRRSEMS